MASYSVHLPPEAVSAAQVAEGALFVKEGFTVTAFLFTGLWLLVKGLWLPLLAFLAANLALAGAVTWLSMPAAIIPTLNLLIAFFIGLEAPTMLRARLRRKRYREAGVVVGRNLEECERRFFESWLQDNGRAAPPPIAGAAPAPRAQPVLGLFPAPVAGTRT